MPEHLVTLLIEAYSWVRDRNEQGARRTQLNFHRRLLLLSWSGQRFSLQALERLASRHAPESLAKAVRSLIAGKVSWGQLRELSSAVLHMQDHALYEAMVAGFDPRLSLVSAGGGVDAAFVGRGIGAGSLNAYRRMRSAGVLLFEKIYLQRSGEYLRSNWFYSDVFPCLDGLPFVVPVVAFQRDGDALSARYFHFVDLRPVAPEQFLERALQVDRLLYELPDSLLERAPAELFAFQQRGKYKAGFKAAVWFLETHGIGKAADLEKLETCVAGLARKFSHGDLSPFNVCQGGEVVDWDSCGVDPLGHDLGYAVTRCMEPSDPAKLVAFFERIWRLRGDEAGRFLHDFLFSAMFFAFVYYARSNWCRASDETLAGLYRYCHDALPDDGQAATLMRGDYALELADG